MFGELHGPDQTSNDAPGPRTSHVFFPRRQKFWPNCFANSLTLLCLGTDKTGLAYRTYQGAFDVVDWIFKK